MYKMGDKVWYAQRKNVEKTMVCPECFGKKYLTVVLGDDSRVTINCAGCSSGYDPAKGFITYYQWETDVEEVVIDNIEITPKGITYGFDGCYRANNTDMFATREKAEIRARELAEEHNKEELEKLSRKEKSNRTWSWNVHYYRSEIRKSKKDIERYEKRLSVAKNIKETK